MADSEYFIQLFLFGATIFCYILLVIFIIYGVYYCCLKSCLKVRRRRQKEREQVEEEQIESTYRDVQLINPFEKSQKVTIVPNPKAPEKHSQTEDAPDLNSNAGLMDGNENKHFVDKKYYDIFVA